MYDLKAILEEAALRLECDVRDLDWFSWPESFASTSGPRGGDGGQMITSFQVFAFDSSMGQPIKCCAGVWKKWDRVIGSRW